MIPAVFWIFLCLFAGSGKGEKESGSAGKGFYLLLACLNLAAGVSSSLAVLLCACLTMGLAVLFALKEKKPGILIKSGFCCIPSALYVLTYLLISH